jgi:hypothetical protein
MAVLQKGAEQVRNSYQAGTKIRCQYKIWTLFGDCWLVFAAFGLLKLEPRLAESFALPGKMRRQFDLIGGYQRLNSHEGIIIKIHKNQSAGNVCRILVRGGDESHTRMIESRYFSLEKCCWSLFIIPRVPFHSSA